MTFFPKAVLLLLAATSAVSARRNGAADAFCPPKPGPFRGQAAASDAETATAREDLVDRRPDPADQHSLTQQRQRNRDDRRRRFAGTLPERDGLTVVNANSGNNVA